MNKHLLKTLFLSIMMILGATGAWADDTNLDPVGVFTWTNTPEINYDASATSWNINQGGISDGKIGKYAGPYAIVKFDAASILSEKTLLSAKLEFDITAGSYNSSINIAQLSDASFDPATVTTGTFDATGTQFQDGEWSTKNTTKHFSYDVKARVEANNVLAFAIYTNTAREQTLKNVKLVLQYSAGEVAKYNYSLKAVTGADADIKTLTEGEEYETNSVTAYFPFMFYNEGTLYTTENTPYSVTFNKDNTSVKVTYTEANSSIVKYMEGEESSACTGENANYSNGKAGYAVGNKTQALATLPAGKYTVTIYLVGNGNRSIVIRNTANSDVTTNTIVSLPIDKNSASGLYTSEEFAVYGETAIGYSGYTSGTKTNQSADIDYIYVTKTGDLTQEEIALAAAKTALQEAITAAEAIETEGKKGVDALTTAIADAKTALAAEDATVETLGAAKTALENAVTAFEEANAADPNDYTSYIVNADLTGEGGFDATGTKGIDGSGIVKVGNAAAFDFKQTIANLPAGKYKVTAQAAYRYGADEAAEAAAIAAGTDTKLVQLYATVGEKTVSAKVQNRYDGASETDYANGDGSVTVNEKFVPNSSNAVKAWFAAGLYVNEVVFNLPADGAVTIGINRTGTPESDYTVIGPWTLTRIGDAEEDPEPETPALTNGDFEGEYTVFASPKSDRDILQPAGWTVTYQNGDENDMTALNSSDKAWSNFENKPQLGETSDNNTYWVRFRWGNSETLTLSQQVILPAGNYKLSADAFFNGANGASATISAAGQSVNVAGNSTWTNHKVIFTVTEEGPVTISLNVTQTQQVENIAAFDNVKLEGVEDIYADLKVEVTAALEAKQSIKTKNALDAALATFTAEQNETNAEVLKAALATTKASINSYKILETGIIPDDKLDGWTCTNSNTFHINTWSGEGNSDGSNMKTPFIENWCNKNDGYLGTGEIFYSLPGLDPGIYQFSALIRAYSEAGNAPTGASLFAGNREKEFATGKNFEYNGMKGIYDTYTMATEVGEDGIFRFGIKIAEDRNFNWMAFKNCKVAYVGNAIDEAAINELAATMPEGKMNAEVKAAAETAIAAAKENMGLDTYEAAMKAITAAQASADAYAATNEILTKMKQLTEETNVYTAEALETYYTQWFDKYNAGTLTVEEGSALQDPFRITGWRTAITCDNFLLSAWDTTPDFPDGVAYYINTWSNEGENDGSNFKVPFIEYWTGDGNSLGEKTLTATMTNLPEGEYDVTAWVRVRTKDETGADVAAYGITFQANEGEAVNAADGETKVALEKNNNFFLKQVAATGTVAEDGELKIKFNIAADNNISWLSFKNVKFEKKPELILTLQGTIGEEVSLTFGAYDTEDTYGVDFGDGNVVEKKVGVNNAGPVDPETGNKPTATTFTGTVGDDGIIKVYGHKDIWYLVSSGAMPTTLDQEKLMNVVQMSITGVNVESVELPAYEKMEQFNFNNSPVKTVDVTKVATLKNLGIVYTSEYTGEMNLEAIDLQNNVELTYLSIQSQKTGANAKLKEIDLSKNTKLTSIYLPSNSLEKVTLPADFTTKDPNDESVLAKVTIFLDNNKLTAINGDLDKLPAKSQINISGNKFTLATLPAKPANVSASKYTYAPQPAYEVDETVSELDLSSQLTATGVLTEPATTTFSFVTAGGTALIEDTDYKVVEPGKFQFLTAQAEKVHGVMATEAFPKFTGANAFVTTEFTVDVDPIAGDANLNGEVTTSDAVAAVSFALGTETPSAKAFKAADVDNSGEITVTDAVAIVNIALEIEPEAPARGEMAEAMNFLTMNGNALELTNTITFVGFQMDVTLANGAMLNGVSLSERAAGLQVAYNRIADNTYRIIAFSTSNTAIEGIDGTLFSLDITGNANINITNIEFADAAARAYALGFGEATGIKGINADATNVEIYTVDGVKSNKVRKGINVVRTADGKVKKVFVK